jgi:hypothetical protein
MMPKQIRKLLPLMKLYAENIDPEYHPAFFAEVRKKYKGNLKNMPSGCLNGQFLMMKMN